MLQPSGTDNILYGIDIPESELLRRKPGLLGLLLRDQTLSTPGKPHNIFWATSDYEGLGGGFEYNSEITPEHITGREYGRVITPRVLKDRDTRRRRTRQKAEIFTPAWVCNSQNNAVDEAWLEPPYVFNTENKDRTWTALNKSVRFAKGVTWEKYVCDIRLEITCGEAPYLVSRYDAANGNIIPLPDRIGLLDRKLRIVGEHTGDIADWERWALAAFKSVYGFDWQGDNVLLARENLLATYIDYYKTRFGREPDIDRLAEIVRVISWNIWQMDGLKYTVPPPEEQQDAPRDTPPGQTYTNKRQKSGAGVMCRIMDWKDGTGEEQIFFADTIGGNKTDNLLL